MNANLSLKPDMLTFQIENFIKFISKEIKRCLPILSCPKIFLLPFIHVNTIWSFMLIPMNNYLVC